MLSILGRLARDQGNIQRAAALYREGLHLCLSVGDRWAIVSLLAGLAEIAATHHQPGLGATLIGFIDTLPVETGAAITPTARLTYDQAVAAVRQALGDAPFAGRREAGQKLRLEEAVALALAIAGPIAAASSGGLTKREHEILRLVATGRTDKEIAASLCLSPRTVNSHVAHLLAKLDVATRQAAAARARQRGLLPADDEPAPMA
ncbi:MAG: LuxR C-terminal-related transcriptional regulator [Chloroflexota bacterium]|nr:LuxR C-terminal-related transcriptional regulator [Chloroflexota bacterium]